ncbi:hypothetical protein LCGC14_2369040 [marine sediment metagenome]|uniref:Uncharacterized protein n=1 Tax=marine sediment metagenome TaxID=412755 RepID=A0A0F9EGT5_9ZZZZ
MSEQPTEAKHTPLPWFVGGDGADIFAGGEAPNYAGARHVADCQPGRPGLLGMESEDAANAQLLVMAPVLLAACRDLLDAFWDMSPLEYAKSRGMDSMSDAEGERIKERARAAIKRGAA